MPKWALLVFLAADNDLNDYATKDLHEMEQVGSSEELSILVHVDANGSTPSRRGVIEKNPQWQKHDLALASQLETIEESNTGDPQVLTDFIVWAAVKTRAENYVLVIWSHGSGWRATFLQETASKSFPGISSKMLDFGQRLQPLTVGRVWRSSVAKRIENVLGSVKTSTDGVLISQRDVVEELSVAIDRAIALDESSLGDALEVIELQGALETAARLLDERQVPYHLVVVGFDACLMSGVEVLFAIKGSAEFVVGSQEIEPGVGWRYDIFLAQLEKLPTLTPGEIARTAVSAYIEGLASYKIRLITMAAHNLAAVESVCDDLNVLAGLLIPTLDAHYKSIAKAEKLSTRFRDKEQMDLKTFVVRVAAAGISEEITNSCLRVMNGLKKLVISNTYAFARPDQEPGGVSIYFPTAESPASEYQTLDFVRKCPRWLEFIEKYNFS